MKSFDVCGVCNALVDILVDLPEQDFVALGLEKATMRLVDTDEQNRLLAKVSSGKPALCSGGSVANSLIAVAQLGGKSAICCRVADDEFGRFYRDECQSLGMHVPAQLAAEGSTGTSLVMITPDAERTMRTSLGVTTALAPEHLDPSAIERSTWLFIEGYVFSNSDEGRSAVKESIRIAKSAGTKVAITCSEAWIVSGFGEHLFKALDDAHLVFANEQEATALANASDVVAAGRILREKFPHVVLTAGERGAFIWWEGEAIHVPAFETTPRDLTGAGDMFAGAFLYGITHGFTPEESARRACFLAHLVISQVGARLKGDVKSLWESVKLGR